MNKKKTILLGGVTVALIAAAFSLGYYAAWQRGIVKTKKVVTSITALRQNNFNWHFIYPLLKYNFNDASPFFEDKTLESKIQQYIQTQYQSNNAQQVSVYYRNLITNQWAGVTPTQKYHPASMMKLIVMIGCYRQAERDPSFMQKQIVYTPAIQQQASTLDLAMQSNLHVGKSYTVKQLVENMIETSDNGAFTLLVDTVDYKILTDIMTDLNLGTPDKDPNYTISPAAYSNLLRILYNTTYLTEADSEEALSFMAKATFRDGIVAGVPTPVLVAQKYGESLNNNTNSTAVNTLELSDCGIVYATNDPYVLCIMTKKNGTTPADEETLTSIIKNISLTTYTYVTRK